MRFPILAAPSVGIASVPATLTTSRSTAAAFVRSIPWIVAATLIVLHPLNAELLRATPAVLFAEVLIAAAGTALLLMRSSRTAWSLGMAALVAAAWVSPLVAWPAAVIPLCRRDLGWRRFFAGLLVLVVAGASVLLTMDLRPGLAELVRLPVAKVLEMGGLLNAAAISAVAPFATPHLGTTREANPAIGAILLGLAVPFLLGRIGAGVTRRWHPLAVLIAVGVLAPVAPTLLCMPHLSTAALLVWGLTAALCIGVAWTVARISRARLRAGALLGVGCAVVVLASFTAPVRDRAFRTWSDEGAAWTALLAEDPGSAYRWEYSEWLRSRGDLAGARTEALRYLRTREAPGERRLAFALAVLREGDDAAAFDLLRRLNGLMQPTSEEDVNLVLALYERKSAWALYFGLADRMMDFPELKLEAARIALRLERMETFRRYLGELVSAERPALAALELRYRDLVAQQDINALDTLGDMFGGTLQVDIPRQAWGLK